MEAGTTTDGTLTQENVGWLDVPVQHAACMDMSQALSRLYRVLAHVLPAELFRAMDPVRKARGHEREHEQIACKGTLGSPSVIHNFPKMIILR